MRAIALGVVILVGTSCVHGGGAPASGGPSHGSPERVDLIEAGIRAVVSPNPQMNLLYVRTLLCPGMGEAHCTETMTDEEIATLQNRLMDLAPELRFVSDYDAIPDGQAPIDAPGRDYVFVGAPEARADGTYRIDAGETCGGLCGHGGTFVLEDEHGTWAST